jgi:glycosyltransferase involved in cell wall biosynthesis
MEAERKIRESKLQERICFAGVVWGERKWQLLADADAFVYPTYYPLEAHPLVVVEALEAGLPVVTTRWAAIPEIIEDGVNGLLASPRDVEDLAEKVLRIIRDPAMRARMSGANRRRFQDFYTHEHYGNRMIDVFETLAAQRDRAAGAQRTATSEGPKRGGRPDVLACGRRE